MKSKQNIKRASRRKFYKNFISLLKKYPNIDKPKKYETIKKYELRKNRKNSNKLNEVPKPIILSKKIDFEKNIDNLVKITEQVDGYINKSLKYNFIIDHSKIEDISIGGILYLVGQVSKIRRAKYGMKNTKLKYMERYGLNKKYHKLKYFFYKSSYWHYFGITKPYKIKDKMSKDYFLSIETDIKSNMSSLNKIKDFINSKLDFLKNDYKLEYKFDDIVKEAMGNSIEHAYPESINHKYREKGKWWICGHYNDIDKSLEIVLYDYGVGIRESMKIILGEESERTLFDKAKDTYKNDSDLIEMAVNGNLSKYKNYKDRDRGKGFKRFKEFVISIGYSCDLTISSGKGRYKIMYDNGTKIEKIEKMSLNRKIDGTLVKWKIKIKDN